MVVSHGLDMQKTFRKRVAQSCGLASLNWGLLLIALLLRWYESHHWGLPWLLWHMLEAAGRGVQCIVLAVCMFFIHEIKLTLPIQNLKLLGATWLTTPLSDNFLGRKEQSLCDLTVRDVVVLSPSTAAYWKCGKQHVERAPMECRILLLFITSLLLDIHCNKDPSGKIVVPCTMMYSHILSDESQV